MKLHFLDRSDLQNKSVSVHHNKYKNFLKVWHYHEQLELVVILKSTGTRFVGDSIEKFNEGEVILLGKNLPHMWLNDDMYFEKDSTLEAEAIAVHFKEHFMGEYFLNTPEMASIQALLKRSRRGIKFSGNNKKIISNIKNLINLNDFEKVIKIIEILHALAKEEVYTLLCNEGLASSIIKSKNKKLDKVYSYVFNNFKEPIILEEVAKIANMNPSAFSRLFKKVNRKTFTKYINEIRIGYSCKLLLEEKYSITDICYESGFNNLSNFNRQFKAITKYSPSEYLKNHIKTV
ncbi:AraC family transcriptional regulator [Flaviramulus sp. BrNp1-15]|uniref:AraC family transcriptional regulator n=1 Tax=Flaviramulus sp. BrNp1-15 TaxID=2916754 RepID=UPI001EE83A1C|nr:AraC family transcriptional regulator [Flaviramulus sp. BrNp1-15]ULC58044.1 AraC family transcriptional regulator [Flaviramulus sp. BrNp1-15]